MAAKTGRTGLIAKKLGMTRLFKEDGTTVPVTVLHVDNVRVVAKRTADKDGYDAVQLGIGRAKAKNVSKPNRGHFAKARGGGAAGGTEFRCFRRCRCWSLVRCRAAGAFRRGPVCGCGRHH